MLCVSSLVGSGWIFELENLLEVEIFLSICQIVCEVVGYRNYFLHIDWQVASIFKKLVYMLNPQYFLWLLEAAFNRYEKFLRKPMMLMVSQCCLVASGLLLDIDTSIDYLNIVFKAFGYFHFIISIVLVLMVLFLIPFCRYVYSKRALRKRLVN